MEVLVTTDSYPDSNTSVNIFNPYTGTKLLSVKGPPAAPKSLVLLKDEGFLISEEGKGKPFIHLWQVGHPLQSSRRIICPVGQQRLGPMAMTPDGNFLVVAIQEKINVWQPATGRIVQVLNSAHYRPITDLKFTSDGTFLISCGADGIVSVWNFLVINSTPTPSPTYSWADHTLPVTSVHLGSGGRKSSLFTVSEDRFLKIYSLISGTLLLSVAFPQGLTSVVVDGSERALFCGGNDGGIYYIDLQKPPRTLEHQVTDDQEADGVLRKHMERITSLAISSDGKHLASGDKGGSLFIWDLESRQAIRTILGGTSSLSKGPVTNLQFWLNDPDLLKGGSGKKPSIVFPDVPKLIESNEEEGEREHLINVWNRCDQFEDYEGRQGQGQAQSSSMAEINQLKVKVKKCDEINRKLHEFCVHNILDASNPK